MSKIPQVKEYDGRPVVTAEKMKYLDMKASRDYGVPSELLMENAGRAVAEASLEFAASELGKKPEGLKVAVCCGRMGPMCIPVYGIFENLRKKYSDIRFLDMDFDIPDAEMIKALPECRDFMGLPFTVYYRGGKVVKATTSIQTTKDVQDIISKVFA